MDLGINGVVLDKHFVYVALRFGVRFGVFRFIPTDEDVAQESLERDHFQGIERSIMNVYDYIHHNFFPDDRVQVNVASNNFTVGGVTSVLVSVKCRSCIFVGLDGSVIQRNQALQDDSGAFCIRATHVPEV